METFIDRWKDFHRRSPSLAQEVGHKIFMSAERLDEENNPALDALLEFLKQHDLATELGIDTENPVNFKSWAKAMASALIIMYERKLC